MAEHPLYFALVWHMHQPYYRDMLTGEISMPWVRTHAAKDYLHMGEVLAAHPKVHLTINMVPSLTEQMLAWAAGEQEDDLARVAEGPEWNDEEKLLILNLGFSVSWDNIIRRYPRYAELLDRRPQALADPAVFSTQDYRDVLAWFNLAWIDPNWLERDPVLAGLVAKGRDYTVEDLRSVHAKQREIAGKVVPTYCKLRETGQLEICASPYYHPILPLLIDTDAARRPSPGLPLPKQRFMAPEDAAAQLQLAVEAHRTHFGAAPDGLWPSEGAVSFEALPFVAAAGFRWLASDEEILGKSLGRPFHRDGSNLITEPRTLYQPYRALTGSELGSHVIFRDHELSDRIGFLYQGLPGKQAAEDMVYRLLEIRRRLNDSSTPYLVTVILDGENCWEHYEHNGDVFLNAFYGLLAERPELRAVTVSEYLAVRGERPAGLLARLATGSWISGDLTTWIGDPEHNRAWDALSQTRGHLVRAEKEGLSPDDLALAWRALYVAEGSDWFWWYSHRNRSDQDALFDRLFRHNLGAVYRATGRDVPGWLERPIGGVLAPAGELSPARRITPQLTAAAYPGEDWAQAATLQPAQASTGTMQRASGLIERLFIGNDQRSLYLRLDLRTRLDRYDTSIYLGCEGDHPVVQRTRARAPEGVHADGMPAGPNLALSWEIRLEAGQPAPFLFRATEHDQWQSHGPLPAAVGDKVLEISVPLDVLGVEPGEAITVLVTLAQGGTVAAQLPDWGMQAVTLTAA